MYGPEPLPRGPFRHTTQRAQQLGEWLLGAYEIDPKIKHKRTLDGQFVSCRMLSLFVPNMSVGIERLRITRLTPRRIGELKCYMLCERIGDNR